ncbi:MAG: hypothetical protein AABN34_17860 [Acidobacteriota bacterium]
MPRTPVPDDLIHRPEEVERNAERFDDLCRLAEEVTFPVVREALVLETAATGAEALTDEVKYALETLADDAAVLTDFDQRQFVYQVQRSLSGAIPPPDEEECRQHSRELSQVLVSTWLESLRSAQAKADSPVVLSDYLLVESPSSSFGRFFEHLGARRTKLPETLTDAFASFAINERDAATIMSTLRLKLFPEPRLVALPFNLTLVGAPGMPVLAMTRRYYERFLEEMERQLEEMEEAKRRIVEQQAHKLATEKLEPESPRFTSAWAQRAAANLSESLPPSRYGYLARAASANLRTESVATLVQRALTTR